MTAPPREPQNLYDALSTIYDWLCDDRLTQWPYMENGPFYSDLPKYQEVARAALAATPAPSADNKPTPGMLRGLSKIAADLAAYRNGTAPSAEPPAQAATDARPEDYFPELVPGDKTLALVGALGRLADYFSPQSGSADAHAIRCKCSKCEWADDIREAGRVLEQQAREIAELRNANSSFASRAICHGSRADGLLTCPKAPCDLCLHWQHERAERAEAEAKEANERAHNETERRLRAEAERDALRECVRAADGQLSRVLHELAGSASLCWEPKPTGAFHSTQACEFVAAAIDELRAILRGDAASAKVKL